MTLPPPPVTVADHYLAAIHDRLGELLDRLPPKAEPVPAGGTVELREPAAPLTGAAEPKPVTSGQGTAPRPVRTTRKPAATKPAARKRTTVKER